MLMSKTRRLTVECTGPDTLQAVHRLLREHGARVTGVSLSRGGAGSTVCTYTLRMPAAIPPSRLQEPLRQLPGLLSALWS